jgi:hypothetical protein
MSPRAAIAATPATLASRATAHIQRVTGLRRSRFTSDAVRTAPDAASAPYIAPSQCGLLARIKGHARPNQSGKKSGHDHIAAHCAEANRGVRRTNVPQTASENIVPATSAR